MLNKDRWNEILEALNANRFRTLMTAFGVFWGIMILVLLLALTNGLKNGVIKDFGDFATNSIFMWSQSTSKAYRGLPKGRRYNFKIDDVALLKEKVPSLKYVSPRNQLGGYRGANNVTRKDKTGAFSITGDYPEFIYQKSMEIIQGRFISYSDINEKRKVAVIGTDVVKSLYNLDEDILESYVKINGVNFLVIGVFNNSNSNGDDEEDANTIFIPFTTFSQVFNYGDIVSWMAITAEDKTNITDIKSKIFSIIKKQHIIHPKDDRAIGDYDLAQQFSKISGLFSILTFVGFFVGTLVLLSGAIGISNIMLIVVKERTKEIGIRRALGATPFNIRTQILQESLLLTIISGMAGIAFASGAIWITNSIIDSIGPIENFANPAVNIKVILIALLILVLFGVLAGLIPATRATRMKPVDALRTE